ncbi:MAG: polysaccharide biosynthesis/export family protein [Succinivibrionaceae bacterium]
MVFGKIGLALVISGIFISGCSFPHAGPSYGSVEELNEAENTQYPIPILKISDEITNIMKKHEENLSFKKIFGDVKPDVFKVQSGDSVDLYIWESSPALLFGAKSYDAEDLSVTSNKLPTQLVEEDGNIRVPFVGQIKVAGKTVRQIEKDILDSLKNKANNPQVMLHVSNRPSAQMTVIGDVKNSTNISLTPKGERVLDALALSSGVSQNYNKIMLSLTRDGKTTSLPLETVIANPNENIYVNAKDVLVAMYQPWTFTVLGPGGKNQEVKLEATGLNIIEAIARVGGLNDNVANPNGVFIFRFENKDIYKEYAKSYTQSLVTNSELEEAEKIPVVYQLYMGEARALFEAQNFKIKNGDVVYLASSGANELSKFLRMVGLIVNPLVSWGNTVNNLAE